MYSWLRNADCSRFFYVRAYGITNTGVSILIFNLDAILLPANDLSSAFTEPLLSAPACSYSVSSTCYTTQVQASAGIRHQTSTFSLRNAFIATIADLPISDNARLLRQCAKWSRVPKSLTAFTNAKLNCVLSLSGPITTRVVSC